MNKTKKFQKWIPWLLLLAVFFLPMTASGKMFDDQRVYRDSSPQTCEKECLDSQNPSQVGTLSVLVFERLLSRLRKKASKRAMEAKRLGLILPSKLKEIEGEPTSQRRIAIAHERLNPKPMRQVAKIPSIPRTQAFSKVLETLSRSSQFRAKEAKRFGITLPSKGGKFEEASPALAKMRAYLIDWIATKKFITPHPRWKVPVSPPTAIRKTYQKPDKVIPKPKMVPPKTVEIASPEKKEKSPPEAAEAQNFEDGLTYNGKPGFLQTPVAFLAKRTGLKIGFGGRYDVLSRWGGKTGLIKGHRQVTPVNLVYEGDFGSLGISIPWQKWELRPIGGLQAKVHHSGKFDPSVNLSLRVGKSKNGTQATSILLGYRKGIGEDYQPTRGFAGKSKSSKRMGFPGWGPAGATAGSLGTVGLVHSLKANSRLSFHPNFEVSKNFRNKFTIFSTGIGVKYNGTRNFSWLGEFRSEDRHTGAGLEGTDQEVVFGGSVKSGSAEIALGVPIPLKNTWNFGPNRGIIFSVYSSLN